MPNQWDDVAKLRASQIESGLDLTFSRVFVPYYLDLLGRVRPESVLEIGGGTGHLARELVRTTRRYTILEPSPAMSSIAVETTRNLGIEVHACTAERFAERNERFDLVISHMCIQAVPALSEFLAAVSAMLVDSGAFVISLPHPAFYNDYKGFFPRDGFVYSIEQATTVSFGITLDPTRLIQGVPYHHRPISTYVAELVNAHLRLKLFDEIFPDLEIQKLYGTPWIAPRYLVLSGFLDSQGLAGS